MTVDIDNDDVDDDDVDDDDIDDDGDDNAEGEAWGWDGQ